MAPALCFTPSAGTGLRGAAALAGSSVRARPLLRVRWCVPLLLFVSLSFVMLRLKGRRNGTGGRLPGPRWPGVSAFLLVVVVSPCDAHWRARCLGVVDVGVVSVMAMVCGPRAGAADCVGSGLFGRGVG